MDIEMELDSEMAAVDIAAVDIAAVDIAVVDIAAVWAWVCLENKGLAEHISSH
jgi:uncharacterized protein (DUF1786 family)